MVDVKPVKLGRNERMSFGKIDEVIQMPHLLDIQRKSYQWFLEEGLREVFKDVSGITDYTGNLVLDFMDYELDVDKPNYSVIECKERDATYSAALRVTARLLNKETGEIKESNVFMGDFPLMTDSGTFVINGAERVIALLSLLEALVFTTRWTVIRQVRNFIPQLLFLTVVLG